MFRARAVLFASLAIAIAAGSATAQERFTLEGREVAIYNLAGSLRIVAGTGSSTVVDVTRVGRDAAKLHFGAGKIDNASSLRVIYPEDEVVYPDWKGGRGSTTVEVAEDGTWGRGGENRRIVIRSGRRAGSDAFEAAADLVVHVPPGVHVLARLGVGDVDATGVDAVLTLNNSAGGITTRTTRGELTLTTASGSIVVTDAEGDVVVNTASGDVQIGNTRSNAVKVDVASGGITVDNVRAPNVDLETASGRIRARGMESSRVKLHTASGSVDAELNGTIQSADIGTASGSVTVRVPSGIGAEVEMEAASGDIDVDFPIRITSQRRGYVRGTIGDGKARVSINTASGSIRLGN